MSICSMHQEPDPDCDLCNTNICSKHELPDPKCDMCNELNETVCAKCGFVFCLTTDFCPKCKWKTNLTADEIVELLANLKPHCKRCSNNQEKSSTGLHRVDKTSQVLCTNHWWSTRTDWHGDLEKKLSVVFAESVKYVNRKKDKS
jgi:hypothetical protein